MTFLDDLLADFTVRRHAIPSTDPRLGRHVHHDSRSLLYQVQPVDLSSLTSIQHTSHIPCLDQGQIGSCVGNATTKVMTYGALWAAVQAALSVSDANVDEDYAVGVYSDATRVDSYRGTYPPDDTGSDGLSGAKVMKNRKAISGYQHATSLAAALTALAAQAIITGTNWTTDMFNPTSAGEIKPTGNVEGGHEYVLDELDVERKRVWMQNSWTTGWGINGRAWMSWDAYEDLLGHDGDATVFTPVTAPAPTPTPPAPNPDPTPVPAPDGFETFKAVGDDWASRRHTSADNSRMQSAYKAWVAAGYPGRS